MIKGFVNGLTWRVAGAVLLDLVLPANQAIILSSLYRCRPSMALLTKARLWSSTFFRHVVKRSDAQKRQECGGVQDRPVQVRRNQSHHQAHHEVAGGEYRGSGD